MGASRALAQRRRAAELTERQGRALSAATSSGRDLFEDGNFDDLGDIPRSNIGSDPAIPLFIMLFTDAPFHDPETEPNYPLPNVNTATRSGVISLLQNTPIIFGMVSGEATINCGS